MLQGLNEELALPLLQQRRRVGPHRERPAVTGRVVMVTGAGGSVGSELVMQIAAAKPKKLVLVDHSELNLYEINCTLAQADLEFEVFPAIANVRDKAGLAGLMEEQGIEIVFHAAALKHVPLLENDHNLLQAVQTNVGGTVNVASCCTMMGADMVLISTDKAVNPSSVMGLTKRVAEMWMASQRPANGRFSQVRFGNVLGSSGSVVPLFRRQLAQGGPITVTHPEMTRYMMSLRQAADLVLHAAAIPPEYPYPMYLLDMGEPIKIIDLARTMIKMSGLREGEDIDIEITGIRPGEKLHEELSYRHEPMKRTHVPGVNVAHGCVKKGTAPLIEELVETASKGYAIERVKALLVRIVPEYQGKDIWK